MSFPLSIITPQGESFNGQADSVTLPGLAGDFAVLTGHAPIVYALKSGKINITQAGQILNFTIDSGVCEVNAAHACLILADNISQA